MACARLTERINLGVSIGFSNGLISVRPKDNQWLILCACVRVGSPTNTILYLHTRIAFTVVPLAVSSGSTFSLRVALKKIWHCEYDVYITWITMVYLNKKFVEAEAVIVWTEEFSVYIWIFFFWMSVKRNVLHGIRRGFFYEILESIDLSILLNSKLCITLFCTETNDMKDLNSPHSVVFYMDFCYLVLLLLYLFIIFQSLFTILSTICERTLHFNSPSI